MKRDIISDLHVIPAILPAAAAQTDNTAMVSAVLDLQGYIGAGLIIQLGGIADADATATVLLEESDASGSGFSAVADADLNGTEALAGFTFADDGECRKLGYVGNKRYIRATITPANNTGALALAATWVLRPETRPAPNPPG
jgi:hypothetical protein